MRKSSHFKILFNGIPAQYEWTMKAAINDHQYCWLYRKQTKRNTSSYMKMITQRMCLVFLLFLLPPVNWENVCAFLEALFNLFNEYLRKTMQVCCKVSRWLLLLFLRRYM